MTIKKEATLHSRKPESMTIKEVKARVFLTGTASLGYFVITDICDGVSAGRMPVPDAATGHAIVRGIRAALTGKV